MAMVARLEKFATTGKQACFGWDFTLGAEGYEVWDEIVVGTSGPGARTYDIQAEDVVGFNRASLETDPMLVDADYAATRGGLIPHPLFAVQVTFYCIDTGIGSWIRSPGARNPGQRIEIHQPFRVGERISARITHWDKWIRRDKHYLEDKVELRNQDGREKTTWFVRLIVPPTREDLLRYAHL